MEAVRLLWSVKEAGTALGLSPWTIRRYIADRKLATVRLGRRVLIEPSECHRIIQDGRVAAIAAIASDADTSQTARA